MELFHQLNVKTVKTKDRTMFYFGIPNFQPIKMQCNLAIEEYFMNQKPVGSLSF